MANAPKTAFQTTTRNFWTGLSWFRNARISSSNWRNKIFWINPYWMKLLSFARLSNIGNTTNFPPFDWGNDNPNILYTFWELNHYLLAVLRPSRDFRLLFTDTWIHPSPLLGSRALSSLSTGLITSYTFYSKKVRWDSLLSVLLHLLTQTEMSFKTGESEHEWFISSTFSEGPNAGLGGTFSIPFYPSIIRFRSKLQ